MTVSRRREMPVTYQIDEKTSIIQTRCYGNVTLSDVLNHLHALACAPNCPERLHVLLDVSESAFVPESQQLRDVSHEIGKMRDKVQFDDCAIVASSDVLFGMSRMFEVFASPWFRDIRVFRTLGEAESWLTSRQSLTNYQST